jgi:hypothetical protein
VSSYWSRALASLSATEFDPQIRSALLVVCKIKRIRKLLQGLLIAINGSDKESGRLHGCQYMSHDQILGRANFCSIATSPFLSRFLKVYTSCNIISSALTRFRIFRTCQVFICRCWDLLQINVSPLWTGLTTLPNGHALTSSCSLSGTA